MLFHSRKGSTEDIVLHPLFVIGVAIGLVLIVLLRAIYQIGSSEEFEKRFIATDTALFVDSVYAVRPDVALAIQYPAGQFHGLISPNKVTVFSKNKEDGQSFFFTEDPVYTFHYGSWFVGKPLKLYKSGNDIGVGETLRLKPYCPPSTKTFNLAISEAGFREGNWAFNGGTPVIKGSIAQGKPLLKIFVNRNKDSELIACRIAQSLFEDINELSAFTIVPLSANLHEEDPKQELLNVQGPALFVELTAPNQHTEVTTAAFTAITRGLHG